jgi:hypothetical protein
VQYEEVFAEGVDRKASEVLLFSFGGLFFWLLGNQTTSTKRSYIQKAADMSAFDRYYRTYKDENQEIS